MPRAFTKDEMREKFLRHVAGIAKYWANLPGKTARERTDGTAFSILAMLDGSAVDMPGFDVVCRPHPDDEQYCKDNGENWVPDGCDIAGALHEGFGKASRG